MGKKHHIEIKRLFGILINKDLSARDVQTYLRLKKSYMKMFPEYYLGLSTSRVDYELKATIFEHYAYELKCVRKYRYWQYLLEHEEELQIFLSTLDDKQRLMWQEYVIIATKLEYECPSLYKEMIKIVNADRQRRLRLKNRISRILEKGNAYFVTLTFNDDVLANTQPHIRRKYASELIRDISNDYVGNIDFGKKNGREHYHFVLHTDTFNNLEYKKTRDGYISSYAVSIDSWSKNGLYFIKQCGNSDSDSTALAKYTTKLTNHAIKETTKRNALIYSR